jgi:Family of unknown function (DUF5684)
VIVFASGGSGIVTLIYLAVVAAYIIGFWMLFSKANQPGWAAIIPFYNIYVLMKVVGRPGWWLILYLIPLVNIIVHIVVMLDLAKSFGRSSGFAVGLIFLPFIFIPILGFGDAQYVGPAAGGTVATA